MMRNTCLNPEKLFAIVLWLVAIHTFIVGLSLVFMPSEYMPVFGFEAGDANFFRAQGGVFHIIMGIIYIMASYSFRESSALVVITVTAKLIATIFLLIYFFFVSDTWSILFSGIMDGLMAIVISGLYLLYIRKEKTQN